MSTQASSPQTQADSELDLENESVETPKSSKEELNLENMDEAEATEPESEVASEGTSILGFVSKAKQISLVGIIESMFGPDASEEFICVPYSAPPATPATPATPAPADPDQNEIKILPPRQQSFSLPSFQSTDGLSWLTDSDEQKLESELTPVPPEVDFCFRTQENYIDTLSASRCSSEVRVFQEERVELERKSLTSDSEEPFPDQLAKNKHLIEKLTDQETKFLEKFGQLTDGLLDKIELICIAVTEAKEILDVSTHGKSGNTRPALEVWNSILKLAIAQLNPPFHRRSELKFFIKTRLKEILKQVRKMSEVTSNCVTQTLRTKVFIGHLMNGWGSRFRRDVWAAVNTQKVKKILDPAAAETHVHTAKVPNMARPCPPKGYGDIGANEFGIQVIWTEREGLILRNLGHPQIPYPKMNFLDRRSIFNAMIREIIRLFNGASFKINTVARLTRHDPGYNVYCSVELTLMDIDKLVSQRESGKLSYSIEALMVNQLRKIEAKLQDLHLSCIDLQVDCNRKLKDIENFYRKRKKTLKGTSKKANEALNNLIQDLQEVTFNFYIHHGAVDFNMYSKPDDLNKTRQIPEPLVCTVDPRNEENANQSLSVESADSLGQVLAKNPPQEQEVIELINCSDEVQNFHSYCHDAITFLKRGVGSLALLQHNLLSPMHMDMTSGQISNSISSLKPKMVTLTAWLWILTKSIQGLILQNQSPAEPPNQITQGALALIPQYEKICTGAQSFQKVMDELCGKTESTADILQKVFHESKIRFYMGHSTLETGTQKTFGENVVRIRMEAQADTGLQIYFYQQEFPVKIPLAKSLELLRVLLIHVNSQVKHANLAACHVQEMKGREGHVIIAWEMHKIKKILKMVNTGKLMLSSHEYDVISETVQDLMTELSRFQSLVKYLAKTSTQVCTEIKHLEKTLFKLIEQTFNNPTVGAGKIQKFLPIRSRSRSPGRPLRMGKGKRYRSSKPLEVLQMELRIFNPISVLILGSNGVVEIKGILNSMANQSQEIPPTEVDGTQSDQKSIFLHQFLSKLQEIKVLISSSILFAGQDLHLPNSAVDPAEFQVSKVEAMCAIIANGILELIHEPKNILLQRDHQLFEQMNILLKEAENLHGVSSDFLDRKELHWAKTGVFKLSESLEIGLMNEMHMPMQSAQLFWSTVVKRKRPAEIQTETDHGKSHLVISWLSREAGLDLKCISKDNSVQFESTDFLSLCRDAKIKILLKLISTAADLIRSTYKTTQDWSQELKVGEEFLKNLRNEVKQELKKIPRGDENLISHKLSEMIHEINLAAACLENYKSTGKKLSVLLREICQFLKASASHKNLPSSSKIDQEGELKSTANIKTTWFTPVMVQIPIILPHEVREGKKVE